MKILKIGKELLFQEGFHASSSMCYYGDEKPWEFEKWLENSINLSSFKDISFNDFKYLYEDKCLKVYKEKVKEWEHENKK